jgi:hypothetical protein
VNRTPVEYKDRVPGIGTIPGIYFTVLPNELQGRVNGAKEVGFPTNSCSKRFGGTSSRTKKEAEDEVLNWTWIAYEAITHQQAHGAAAKAAAGWSRGAKAKAAGGRRGARAEATAKAVAGHSAGSAAVSTAAEASAGSGPPLAYAIAVAVKTKRRRR